MKAKKIVEATVKDAIDQKDAEAVASQIDADLIVDDADDNLGDIEKALNAALQTTRDNIEAGIRPACCNVLLEGDGGVGKSERVEQWARKNGINLVKRLVAGMDPTDFTGVPFKNATGDAVQYLTLTIFDDLKKPNSVLFLDEYNRASSEVRSKLLDFIQTHKRADSREETDEIYYENFLFTIAAMNPANTNYDTHALDSAELSRFEKIDVKADINVTKRYFIKEFTRIRDEQQAKGNERLVKKYNGLIGLTNALLVPGFKFDTGDEVKQAVDDQVPPLNPRSLMKALNSCDGTKEDLLARWNRICNPAKKSMAETLLAKYTDVDDKANRALKDAEEEPIFKQKQASLSDRLKQGAAARP